MCNIQLLQPTILRITRQETQIESLKSVIEKQTKRI